MPRISKTEFLRGVGAFNPAAYGAIGTPEDRRRLKAKIASYDAQKGGKWNYNSLYATVEAVLRGFSVDRARSSIVDLDGLGEATAKLAIFDGLRKIIPFGEASLIEEGGQTIAFGNHQVSVRPDFSYKTVAGVFCVFVYPYKSPPLKVEQKAAIVNAIASQERDEQHFLILAEYPEISGRRQFSSEIHSFRYRSMDEDFVRHMTIFYDLLDARSDQGDLFDG